MKWLSISGFKYFLKASWSSYFDNLPSPFVSKALKIESITIILSCDRNKIMRLVFIFVQKCSKQNKI